MGESGTICGGGIICCAVLLWGSCFTYIRRREACTLDASPAIISSETQSTQVKICMWVHIYILQHLPSSYKMVKKIKDFFSNFSKCLIFFFLTFKRPKVGRIYGFFVVKSSFHEVQSVRKKYLKKFEIFFSVFVIFYESSWFFFKLLT